MKRLPSKLPKELADRFQVVDNTLKRAVKQNPKDKIELEIGDSKQPDFLPQAKIMRWDNEVNFSARFVDNEPGEPVIETKGKVIKYVKPKVEFHAYELDLSELGEDGGLEIELLLKEKPDTNKFDFTIQTKELDFFYQPALTQQEIDEGASRPENVVGSYAVYHKTKGGMNRIDGMEYKTGKAFHIYRPKVTDANGVETWGELSIDEQNGELSVTIDQAWLDTAVYPVLVDPTFGYTTVGTSTNTFAADASNYNERDGTAFSGVDGILSTISANLRTSTATDSIDNITFINTKDSGGAGTHDQVAAVERLNLSVTTTKTWYDFTYSSQSLSSSNTYILSILGDGADVSVGAASELISYDTGGGGTLAYEEGGGTYTAHKESPWTATDASNRIFSIYATYIAGIGVANSTDDARNINGDSTFASNVATQHLGKFSTTDYWSGWRWNNVNVSQGSTIISATINLYSANITAGTTAKIILYGVDEDDVATFANSAGNKPEGKTRTTASVTKDLTVASWASTGFDKELIDVTTLVQEIVDRGGWVPGNDMAIVAHDNGSSDDNYVGFSTYDSAATRGALLNINWEAQAAATLTDNFDDNSIDGAKWDDYVLNSATAAESSGKVILTPANSTADSESGFNSVNNYNLTGSYAKVQLVQAADVASCYTTLKVQVDSSNYMLFGVRPTNELFANKIVAASGTDVGTATYNSAVHKYLKIREASGTIYFDYSTDGSSYSNFGSVANPFAITAVMLAITVYELNSDASPGAAHFDDFNIDIGGGAATYVSTRMMMGLG